MTKVEQFLIDLEAALNKISEEELKKLVTECSFSKTSCDQYAVIERLLEKK